MSPRSLQSLGHYPSAASWYFLFLKLAILFPRFVYVITLQVTEAKAKLETMQTSIRELEKERHQMQQECQRLEAQAKDKLLQEMVGEVSVCMCVRVGDAPNTERSGVGLARWALQRKWAPSQSSSWPTSTTTPGY